LHAGAVRRGLSGPRGGVRGVPNDPNRTRGTARRPGRAPGSRDPAARRPTRGPFRGSSAAHHASPYGPYACQWLAYRVDMIARGHLVQPSAGATRGGYGADPVRAREP